MGSGHKRVMVKNRTRDVSPPLAYAKYLDDFEECDETQASESTSTSLCRANCSRFQQADGYCSCDQCEIRRDTQQHLCNHGEFYNKIHSHAAHFEYDCVQRTANEMKKESTSTNCDENTISEKEKNSEVCNSFGMTDDCNYEGNSNSPCDSKQLMQKQRVSSNTGAHFMEHQKLTMKPCVNEIESSNATYQQLEQRLRAIQRELNMLEEEGKKPKSSVVVPKRSQQLFVPSGRAAFNVGDDFVVKVGNSIILSDECENNPKEIESQERGVDKRLTRSASHAKSHSSRHKKLTPLLPREAGGLHLETRKRVNLSAGRMERMAKCPMSKRSRVHRDVQLYDISDDDDNKSNGRMTDAEPLLLDGIMADEISNSDDAESSTSVNLKESLAVEAVSDDSDADELESLIADDLELSRISEDGIKPFSTSEVSDSEAEPLDLTSVIDPSELSTVSDGELVEDDSAGTRQLAKSVSLLELSFPDILRSASVTVHFSQKETSTQILPFLTEDAYDPVCLIHTKDGSRVMCGEEQRKYIKRMLNCFTSTEQVEKMDKINFD